VTFDEIIDSMINVDLVPEKKRQGEYYEAAKRKIHDDLAEIEDVEAVAYHEAAHSIYSALFGFRFKKDTSSYKIFGPRIKYHPQAPESVQYEPISSGFETPGFFVPFTDNFMMEAAKIAVAGGEAVRYFHPTRRPGDASDRVRFEALCKSAGSSVRNAAVYWRAATCEVRREFQDSQHRLLIAAKAELVKREVFPAVFSNTKATI
jgi:hypothetical protein